MDKSRQWIDNLSRKELEDALAYSDKQRWEHYYEVLGYKDWAGGFTEIKPDEDCEGHCYSLVAIRAGIIVPYHIPEALFFSERFAEKLAEAARLYRWVFGRSVSESFVYQDEIEALEYEPSLVERVCVLLEKLKALARRNRELESDKTKHDDALAKVERHYEAIVKSQADKINELAQSRLQLKTELDDANRLIGQLRANQNNESSPDGCVYIIKSPMGEYKIGKTKNLQARFAQLQTGSPLKLKFILSIVTDDMDNLEARLHRRFADKRGIGEWFTIDDKDIRAIRKEYSDWLVELD